MSEKDDLSTTESIDKVINESDAELGEYAESYYNSLSESESKYGDKGVSTQAKYIASNIEVTDEESRKLKKKIERISEGKSPELEDEENNEDLLTMQEFEDISRGFESFTERNVRKGELVTINDFKRYSQNTGYNLNKVLCSNPWVDSKLTMNAKDKIEHANKLIEFDF